MTFNNANFSELFKNKPRYKKELSQFMASSGLDLESIFAQDDNGLTLAQLAYKHAVISIKPSPELFETSLAAAQNNLAFFKSLGGKVEPQNSSDNVFFDLLPLLPKPEHAYHLYLLAEPQGHDWNQKIDCKNHWECTVWSLNSTMRERLSSYTHLDDIALHELKKHQTREKDRLMQQVKQIPNQAPSFNSPTTPRF